MDPVLNANDADYDANDPGTWYTASQLAFDYARDGKYGEAADVYYELAVNCGNSDVYSWLRSENVAFCRQNKGATLAQIISVLNRVKK